MADSANSEHLQGYVFAPVSLIDFNNISKVWGI